VHNTALIAPALAWISGPPTPEHPAPLRRFDPTCRLRGWRVLAAEVDRVRAEFRARGEGEPVLACTSWSLPGEVGFYCDGHPNVYSVGLLVGDRHSQYDLWHPNPIKDTEHFRGQTFLIIGGSADELSVRSVLPRFVEMEAKHGSLGKAMTESKTRQGGSAKPLFTSLKNGMQQMTGALVSRIPESARRVNAPVEAVKPESGKWLLLSTGRTEEFDAVIVAIPAYEAGKLLPGVKSKIAEDLTSIPYSSSVTVTLGYDESVRAALPPGFGFLVPRTENVRIIAATFVHNKFPNRVPATKALLRCFLGGTRDESILNASEGEIEEIVRRDLGTILGIRTQQTFCRVYKWHQAMAQYTVGHGARVERIRAQLADMPGLALAGNAYAGIGVPDCIRSGSEAATKVVTDLTPLE